MIKTSLLLLVFNGEKYLNRALLSVYNQTIKLDEVLIVNDGSNDQTINIQDIIYDHRKVLYWKDHLEMEKHY